MTVATPADWVRGDASGMPIAATAADLRAGGADYLTRVLRAAGTLGEDDRVLAMTRIGEWLAGGTGSKLQLDVRYARVPPELPVELFVKFSRNFDDPIKDNAKHHMEPEVRLARLSQSPGFPVAVPRCLFADFHHESGTGILITERVAYGRAPIEPQYPKCLDFAMPRPLEHYRALTKAVARLAGTHKAGRLPARTAREFPFDHAAALAGNRLAPREKFAAKLVRLADFATRYPQLLPASIADPVFLGRFTEEARMFHARQDAICRFLHDDPDLIALCHWNANVDNAWFWRDASGEQACGLMDWGSVGQMSLAMTLWGCLSGAEPEIWADHLDELLALFACEFEACGAPALNLEVLRLHFDLYVSMMGLAWLMDAPGRILREVPELAAIRDRFDPRFTVSETARVQLLMMTNFLNLWQRDRVGDKLKRFADPG